jgi:hypothetical protein
LKHSLLSLPHSYSPRLDVAIHLRAQFHHFEQQTDINDPEYRREVSEWLNSTECRDVFGHMKNQLLENIKLYHSSERKSTDPLYVYLASDNEDVKDAFIDMINLI